MAVFDPWQQALIDEGVAGTPLEKIALATRKFESGGNNAAVSNHGATGWMQVMPGTFTELAEPGWSIKDPYHNARAGIRYLKKGWEASGGDPALTGAYYYGGPGGMAKAKNGVAVYDPKNPKAPNTLQYGERLANAVNGDQTMSTNFPNLMAKIAGNTPEIYSQLAGLVGTPEVDPATVEAISQKRQKSINMLPLAMGAMLSGDKAMRDVGKTLYKTGEDARNLMPIGDEGYIDPEQGKFLKTPVGDERRALAMSIAALGSDDKRLKVAADYALQEIAQQNTQWFRQYQLQLERLGIDVRQQGVQVKIAELMADKNFRFYLESQGIDPKTFRTPMAAPAQGAPTGASQGVPAPVMPAQGAPAMPAQGALGGLDIPVPQAPAQAPARALPNTMAAISPPAQPQDPQGVVRIPNGRRFTTLPSPKLYGTDPVSGQKVFEQNGIYVVQDPGTNSYVEVQVPGFKSNAEIKAGAEAQMAQLDTNNALEWTKQNALDPNTPYVNYEQFMKTSPAEAEAARKYLEAQYADIEAGRQTNALMERFRALNAKDETGGPLDRAFPKNLFVQSFSPDSQEMISLSSQMEATAMPKGQGAVSDAERRLFSLIVPSVQFHSDVNNAIIDMFQMRLKFREDAARLSQEYYNKYKHTNGMEQAVAKQLDEQYSNDPEYQRLLSMVPNTPMGNKQAAPDGGGKPRFTIMAD